jgi:ABC-type transport system substrate-binding protein
MYKAGEVDIAQLPALSYHAVKNDPKANVIWSQFTFCRTLVFYDLAFPNEPSPFHDVRVRRAVSYAINRKAICEKVLHGCAEPYGDLIAPYQPGANPDGWKPFPYDPEKAKALMKEAGYPNGFDFVLHSGYLNDQLEVQAIAADLARVGIRGKIDEVEMGIFFRNFREKKFRGLGVSPAPYWGGDTHPAVGVYSSIASESYWSYVTTPEADAALKKLSTLTDEKEIAAQAKELSRLWHESELRYTLWAYHQPFGLSSRVKSWKPVPGWAFIAHLESLELKD